MLKKFAAPLVIVSAASAVFFACSSDSSSSGPAEEPPASSSDKIATNSSSSLRLSSANLSSSSIDVSVSAETSSSDKATDKVGEPTEPAEVYLWHDEFDSIDTATWTFETGTSGWGNNEWQYYTGRSENAFVQDGILHIRANKEDYEGAKYTSARMITKGKFSFTYGTVEARIALPVGKGIWPAFWMLGENIDAVSWPACGEIDIIEAVNSENIVYGTNHWQFEGSHAEYGNNTNDFHGAKKELDITQFHTYKLVWDEKLIAMYVDDFKYHEISIENNAGGTDAFHKPQFLLLNVAVAGNWPGFEVDDTQFPNEMLVDYIRVSQ
ncbi:glycoside hydrolase family 16 protein [Fibrobacter sp. UBA3629]|uniref:glycoside hydrolase family 16 protein n=1 Tax=Fibrobacter sp. UBA3629 TaxID=1946530 RepID=UPI0025C03251|nr:glycoside hydrolase family 16 protein [Fibrobacter sp. UBA3629]